MPHEDVNFLGNTFAENLDNILYYTQINDVIFGSTGTIIPSVIASNIQVGEYFDSINIKETRRLPPTWDDFVTEIVNLFEEGDNIPETFAEDLEDQFVTLYRRLLGIGGTADESISTSSGDWQQLALAGVNADEIRKQFKTFFGHFLTNYVYAEDGTLGVGTNPNTSSKMQLFFLQLAQSLTVISHLDSDTDTIPADGTIASYERIYFSYFGEKTQDDFRNRLEDFYVKQVKEHGFFVPSLAFSDWFEEIQDNYIEVFHASSVSPSPAASQKLLIIDRILKLLISMIDVLNSISASQASRLSGFLTDWQRAYTELMDEVPNFSQDDGTKVGAGSDTTRGEINQDFSALVEKVRSRRSLVQDDAKAMQSVINQTQDAANQQTNIATAILQQLSTILGAIFK